MSEDKISSAVAQQQALLDPFFLAHKAVLAGWAAHLTATFQNGGRLFLVGSGPFAAIAGMLGQQFLHRQTLERPPLPAMALSTDTSCLTAVGNDRGFDRVFSRQVEALGRAGDVAVALTTSGRSPNVVRALRSARTKGLITIGLTGRGGGAVAPLADYLLDVASGSTARIQEAHLFILHLLAGRLEEAQASGG